MFCNPTPRGTEIARTESWWPSPQRPKPEPSDWTNSPGFMWEPFYTLVHLHKQDDSDIMIMMS